MIVQCISFGSAWWLRPTYDEHGVLIRSLSAFMNTTTAVEAAKVRWSHRFPGFVRIEAGMTPQFDSPREIQQAKFYTRGPYKYQNSCRLHLSRRASQDAKVDQYLVRVRSTDEGSINLYSKRWRSGPCTIIASSFRREVQETLLLIAAETTIQTTLGKWGIVCKNKKVFLGLKEEME